MVQLSQMAIRGSPVNFGETRYVETYVLWFWKKDKWFQYVVDNAVKVVNRI